jgi:hypothetical protein
VKMRCLISFTRCVYHGTYRKNNQSCTPIEPPAFRAIPHFQWLPCFDVVSESPVLIRRDRSVQIYVGEATDHIAVPWPSLLLLSNGTSRPACACVPPRELLRWEQRILDGTPTVLKGSFVVFAEPLQTNTMLVARIRLRPLPSTPFPINYAVIMPTFVVYIL